MRHSPFSVFQEWPAVPESLAMEKMVAERAEPQAALPRDRGPTRSSRRQFAALLAPESPHRRAKLYLGLYPAMDLWYNANVQGWFLSGVGAPLSGAIAR